MAETTVEPIWIQNVKKEVDKDINGKRLEYYFECPQFILDFLQVKPNNSVLAHCLFNCFVANVVVLLTIPIFYYDYLHWGWLLSLVVLKFVLVGAPRFILALHATTHSPCVKPKWFNTLITEYFMCPLHGILPGMYRTHHVIMHHKENNICPRDLSSTMPYQRDNLFGFLHYYLRFQISLIFEMPYWLFNKGLYQRLIGSCFIFASWFICWYILYNIKPSICIILLILPNVIGSLFLMFGNWSQHQFINPNDYDNDFSLTTNVIGAKYNMMAFNDGYHIIHHRFPYLHFKQLPLKFLEAAEFKLHQKYNSLNFKNIDQFVIGVCVHMGFYDTLFNNFLPITKQQYNWTKEQFIKEIKRRLKPVDQAVIQSLKKLN